MLPAGQGRQANLVRRCEPAGCNTFPPSAGVVLSGAVIPRASQRFGRGECAHARHARPVDRPIDQTFLAAVLEDVAQATHRRDVVGDDDGAVAPAPKPLTPVMKPSYFTSDVAVDECNEASELGGVVHGDQSVEMVTEKHKGVNTHGEKPLGAPHDSQDHVVYLG